MTHVQQEEKYHFSDDDLREISILRNCVWNIEESRDESADEWLMWNMKYYKITMKVIKKIYALNQYPLFRSISFLNEHPKPISVTDPLLANVSCCVCGLIGFRDDYDNVMFLEKDGGQTYGGMTAKFYYRKDVFDQYTCSRDKSLSEDDPIDFDRKLERCCFRFRDESGICVNHCALHCDCFEVQHKGDTRSLAGSFGSVITDDQQYQFIGSNAKFIVDGLVCDWCINNMIFNGELHWLCGSLY